MLQALPVIFVKVIRFFERFRGDCAGILLQTTRKLHRYGTGNIAVCRIFGFFELWDNVRNIESCECSDDEVLNGVFLLIKHVSLLV